MKLWAKYITALATVGVIGGSAIGGLYAYTHSDAGKGLKHYSGESLAIRLDQLSNIKSYDMSFRDPVDTKRVVASYKYDTTVQGSGAGTVNGKNANEFVESYYKEHKQSPVMFINAGGIKFTNFYSEVILPRDFTEFVEWFAKNISWTPGLSSITSYTLKKGVESDGRTVILGSYTAIGGERKEIKFMPDSFFGKTNVNNFIYHFSKAHLTKAQVKKTIALFNKNNRGKTEEEKLYIYSAQSTDDGKYILNASLGGKKVIDAANKMYSKHEKVSDLDITLNSKGEMITTDRPSMKLSTKATISKLDLMRGFADDGKWKGIGLNFLKYVTTHEYGHMQTLSMARDSVTKPVSASVSPNAAPAVAGPNAAINLDVLNGYLAARLPNIRAIRVSPILVQDEITKLWKYNTYENAIAKAKKDGTPAPFEEDFSNVAYEYTETPNSPKFTLEELDKIFPGKIDPTDSGSTLVGHTSGDPDFASEKAKIIATLKAQVASGENHYRFMMRDVTDLKAFAKFLKVPAPAIAFMNANDNLLGTVSSSMRSGVDGVPFGKELDTPGPKGKWVFDNVFTILAKDNITKMFIDETIVAGVTGHINNPVTKLQVKIQSPFTKKEYFINPAIVPTAITTDDEKVKYMETFKTWFTKTLLNQDRYSITGNGYMHERFDVKDAVKAPFGGFQWNSAGSTPEQYKEKELIFQKMNDLNAKANLQFTHIGNGRSIIKNYTIGNGAQLIDMIEKDKDFGRLQLHMASDTIAVVNGERILPIGANRAFDGTTKGLRATFAYQMKELFGNFSNQRAGTFAIFKDQMKSNPVLLFGDTETNKLVSEIASTEENEDKIKDEMKRLNITIPTTKISISEMKELIAKNLIKKAKKIKLNNGIDKASGKGYTLKGIDFKLVTFIKLFDLLFLNSDNAEGKHGIASVNGNTNRHYLFLNEATLKQDFIKNPATVSVEQIRNIQVLGYYKLLKGIKDKGINDYQSFKKYYSLFTNLGDLYQSTRSAIGDFRNYVDKQGSIIDVELKKLYNKYNTIDKGTMISGNDKSIKTILAWSESLGNYGRFLGPADSLHHLADISKLSLTKSIIDQWIDDFHEGYQTSLQSIFSDYTSQFAEVLTRDWVQMTFVPNFNHDDPLDGFRYQSKYTNIVEGKSGIELYINPKAVLNEGSVFTKYLEKSLKPLSSSISLVKLIGKEAPELKTIFDGQHEPGKNIGSGTYWYGTSTEGNNKYKADLKYLITPFNEKQSNNGYYKDRWLRTMHSSTPGDADDWSLYKDDGTMYEDTNIRMKGYTVDPTTGAVTEKVITHRPEAYWWWLLKSYGVGDRSVTGMWRVPNKDATSMWGYLPTPIANKVKYIKATSSSGAVEYIKVHVDGTNNLFYLTHQGDAGSKHTLADDGFKSWTIDLLTAGTWTDSKLSSGKWTLEFVDNNRQLVQNAQGNHNAFTLGSKNMLTENNKREGYAPIVMKEENGKVVMTIRDQFSV